MIRVLHVIPRLGLGGAERVALDLVRHASKYNVEARLCVLYGPAETFDESVERERISFLGGRPGFKSPTDLWTLGKELRQLFRAFQPDIVHSHLRPADMMVAGSLSGKNLPHISHQHDTTPALAGPGYRAYAKREMARRLYKRSDARFIFVSRAVERYLTDVLGQWSYKSRVIHNGADGQVFFAEAPPGGAAPQKFVFGTAARLAPEKGIDVLLRAFQAVHKRANCRARLLIAGTGRSRGELRSLAADLDVLGSVEFLGPVRDMRRFYNSIDAFVLPSRHSEGFPLSIVEAMFCRRPVLATRVAGAVEAIEDGHNGFLVPADAPEMMGQAMEAMMRSDTLLRLGQQAERDAKARFGLQGMLQQVTDFYRSTLEMTIGEDLVAIDG